MNVAVCLSGLTRSVSYGWPLIERYLVRPYASKVFIHTWDIDNGGVRSQSDDPKFQWMPSFMDGRTKNQFIDEEMKPTKYVIEDYQKWSLDSSHLCQPAHAMYYSIYMSNELRKKYEAETQTKFDVIIMARMDCFFENYLDKEYLDNVLLDSNLIYGNLPGDKPDHRFITDVFAIGSSYAMDAYSSVWQYMYNTPVQGAAELLLQSVLAHKMVKFEWALKIRYRMLFQWNTQHVKLWGNF